MSATYIMPLTEFMRGVDFEWNNFRPFKSVLTWVETPQGFLAKDSKSELFYLKNHQNTQVMGWVHNRSAYWANAENLHPELNNGIDSNYSIGVECYFAVDPDSNPITPNSIPIFCPDDDLGCQAPFQLASLAPRAMVLLLQPELSATR